MGGTALKPLMYSVVALITFMVAFSIFTKIVLSGGSISVMNFGMLNKMGSQVGGVMESAMDKMFESIENIV